MTDLEGLIDLDPRGGVDMRPTLLRVLTDLYLQKPAHSADDERYYTELALRLIDATDVEARAALAARLARYPAAPREVILRLARDVIEVAEPVLTWSRALTRSRSRGDSATNAVRAMRRRSRREVPNRCMEPTDRGRRNAHQRSRPRSNCPNCSMPPARSSAG